MDRGRLIIPVSWFPPSAGEQTTTTHCRIGIGSSKNNHVETHSALNLQLPMMYGHPGIKSSPYPAAGACVGFVSDGFWFSDFGDFHRRLRRPKVKFATRTEQPRPPTISPTYNSRTVIRPSELDRDLQIPQQLIRPKWPSRPDKAVLPFPPPATVPSSRKVKLRAKTNLRAEGGSSDQGPRGRPPVHLESPCSSRVIGQSVIRSRRDPCY
ncbi:uncharacterized protein B0H64DRAFT_382197 [Chaetomium fimeti]|uniref:Uncharacterized protein n=1 Tax=Chaetomium fimeti TaxID=1854472 RepID=A0AAE0LXD8_9PEZI|nr:hypothetical protein B0H64DRAFT_382197 [Chaetomium fimeti]